MKWEKWCVVTSLLNSQNPLSTNQQPKTWNTIDLAGRLPEKPRCSQAQTDA